MNTEEQDKFLNDFNYRDVHLFLQEDQIDFLKTFDTDGNISKGTRKLIELHMRQTRLLKVERHLLFLMVLLILILGLLQIVIL